MTMSDWTSPKWVNTDGDEGAVGALLDRLGHHVPPATVDQLWVFATRRGGGVESTVFVVATFTADDDRRDVSTARFTVTRDRKGRPAVAEQIDHHATAPVAAVARVVDGVLRRLGDDAAQPPRLETIAGDESRWVELVRDLGGTPSATAAEPAEPPADADGPAEPHEANRTATDADEPAQPPEASATTTDGAGRRQ